MLITHKQSLIMLSITCRCILYALVSVVVPWGVALGWVRMRLGGGKSTVYSLQKARLHHWGIITVLYIHTRCVVHEELGHAPWPTFLRFVVFAFSPPHVYLGWPRPRCLSSATGVGEEQRFTQFEAASPSAAKRLDAPSQHVDKQSIHTRVTAEQCASQREMCAC